MKLVYTLAVILLAFNVNAQLTNGLVAHWEFSGNANDATGNGHNGTTNNITYTTGRTGAANTAALFNGTSSFITVPNSTDWNLSTFTIATMIKLNGFYTGACQASMIIERGSGYSSGNWGLVLFDNAFDSSCTVTGDTSKFTFYGEAGPNNNTMPHAHQQYTPTTRTNTWYCVIATFDSTDVRLYIDGVNVFTVRGNSVLPIGTSNDIVAIGANRFGNYSQYPFWLNGAIDDLRIYNRALSATEINSLCSYTSSVSEIDAQKASIYPNPNNGSFKLSANNLPNDKLLLQVVDMPGRVVYSTETHPLNGTLNESINMGNPANGMYMLRLSANGYQENIRFSINR